MAVGDVKAWLDVIGPGAVLNVRPPSGEEWVIHNLYFGGSGNISITDGTASAAIDSLAGAGARTGLAFHVTYWQYLVLTNTSGVDTITMAYDGIQTK